MNDSSGTAYVMIAHVVAGLFLAQAVPSGSPADSAQTVAVVPDSATIARLRARVYGQDIIRVRVGSDLLELTRPRLLDTAIAFRDAWSDRLDGGRDTALANPLPLSRATLVQVRGKQIWPSVIGGGLSLGISALGSLLLTKAFNTNSGIDGNEIVRVTALALGVGAAVGAADGALRTRWVTAWRRETGGENGTDRRIGEPGAGQAESDPKSRSPN